jgi:hypothetical protein
MNDLLIVILMFTYLIFYGLRHMRTAAIFRVIFDYRKCVLYMGK